MAKGYYGYYLLSDENIIYGYHGYPGYWLLKHGYHGYYFPSSNLLFWNRQYLPSKGIETVKFGTDTDKYGNRFSKYQRACQLFSFTSYATYVCSDPLPCALQLLGKW